MSGDVNAPVGSCVDGGGGGGGTAGRKRVGAAACAAPAVAESV